MTHTRRVLLVQPLEGARWRSITAYAGAVSSMLQAAGIEVEVAQAPWFNPPSLLRAGRWWRQPNVMDAIAGKFDLVHLTDQALAHHTGRFAVRTPVAVTCHDLMPMTTTGYYGSRREALLKRAFLQRPIGALRDADTVIAVSAFTAGELARTTNVDPSRVRVVPNVVRPVFRPRPRAEAEAALANNGIELPSRPRVLSVGNDRAYKNLPALLEAMAHPSLAHPSLAHTVLVRVGPFTRGQRALVASLGLQPRLVQPGAISDDALGLLYGACDVLAQPSVAEGFGVPLVEAMASGLPVVSSDGGALAEVCGDAGLVVALEGVEFSARFAKAISEALAHRDDLSAAGLLRAARFTPAAVVPGLISAYELAIEAGRHRLNRA